MSRLTFKLDHFIRFAADLKDLSTCRRAKCAAIIFDADCTRVYAIGYNGPPRGSDNESCTGTEGACGCAHAEANALIKVREVGVRDAVLYSTTYPCPHCAALIANSGVVGCVLYSAPYRDMRLEPFLNAGIKVLPVYVNNVIFTELNGDLFLKWREAARAR